MSTAPEAGSPEWMAAKDVGKAEIAGLVVRGEVALADARTRTLARELGVSVAALRQELPVTQVAAQTAATDGTGVSLIGPSQPEPAASPFAGAALLDRISRLIRMRVTLPQEAADAVALWCAGTWGCRPLAEGEPGPARFPRLAISSAAKRCGKSTLLETVALLVARPLRADDVSEAVLFRAAATAPTFLIDEADLLLRRLPTIRAVMNSGFARDGATLRNVEVPGKAKGARDWAPASFPTFAPMALAGIGNMPDTVADRAVRVRLERKPPGGRRWRAATLALVRATLGPHLAGHSDAWATAMEAGVEDSDLPAELDDRAGDAWEPLLAIAKSAGGDWPQRARRAAVALAGTASAATGRERALAEVWSAIKEARVERVEGWRSRRSDSAKGTRAAGRSPASAGPLRFIASDDLARRLRDADGSFASGTREDSTKKVIARAMEGFGVSPCRTRVEGTQTRGYRVAEVRAVWRRYRPPGG